MLSVSVVVACSELVEQIVDLVRVGDIGECSGLVVGLERLDEVLGVVDEGAGVGAVEAGEGLHTGDTGQATC